MWSMRRPVIAYDVRPFSDISKQSGGGATFVPCEVRNPPSRPYCEEAVPDSPNALGEAMLDSIETPEFWLPAWNTEFLANWRESFETSWRSLFSLG